MSICGKSQEVALELLLIADKICRENDIPYTITGETLWGAVKCNGFLPWSCSASITMFYNDYKKFLEVSRDSLKNTSYYIANGQDMSNEMLLYSFLCKRSRVTLSEDRKQDEFYYDFIIEITPLFDCSNTQEEFEVKSKQFLELLRVMNTRMQRTIKPSAKKYMKKSTKYFISKKDTFERLKQYQNGNSIPTCFVLWPKSNYGVFGSKNYFKEDGCVVKSSTYLKRKEVEFEGHFFFAPFECEQWLIDYYSSAYKKDIDSFPVNAFLLKGPEELRRVQLVQLEILLEVDRICRKYGIPYFLCSGTLLGAVRHRGFVPWDYDVDLAMFKADYDRFLDIAKKEMDSDKFFIRNKSTEPTINIIYTQIRRFGTRCSRIGQDKDKKAHLGIFIDIFPVNNGIDNYFIHKIRTKLCLFFKTMFWTHTGAHREKKLFKRIYYKFLAKFSPELSYNLYTKLANMYEGKPSKKISWLVAVYNEYNSVFTDKKTYLKRQEILFEGHKFYTISEWDKYLICGYTADYMIYPVRSKRYSRYVAAEIDAGELFKF